MPFVPPVIVSVHDHITPELRCVGELTCQKNNLLFESEMHLERQPFDLRICCDLLMELTEEKEEKNHQNEPPFMSRWHKRALAGQWTNPQGLPHSAR